ncbi:MAG: GNAT family acetyltransferase [Verrucomicrobiota bacterium]|nr:GNAT family acetyltransferase [Verrucomicrobiota bacterium]
MSRTTEKRFEIRKFQRADRERVRELCCETGFLGNPIDPIFEDRALFADYLTAYYTDWEPESAFVLLMNGEICGYLLGSRHPLRQQLYNLYNNVALFGRGLFRYWGYNAASRKFVHWILKQAWREVPATPRRVAHFHVNLLPDARSVPQTRALMDTYLRYLRDHGEKHVYGQMVVFEDRRSLKMFERYGFKVLNKAPITKYRELHPEPVYLCTVIKDLEENDQLYAKAL